MGGRGKDRKKRVVGSGVYARFKDNKWDANEYHKHKKRNIKKILVDFKGGKCVVCNGIYPECCYDFHHIDPKLKEFNLAGLMQSKANLDKAKKELNKCILVCSNCHRLIHAWGYYIVPNGDLRSLRVKPRWSQPVVDL